MNARKRPRYADGDSGDVVNIRTFTTHIGFVRIAVIAPGIILSLCVMVGVHGDDVLASAEQTK